MYIISLVHFQVHRSARFHSCRRAARVKSWNLSQLKLLYHALAETNSCEVGPTEKFRREIHLVKGCDMTEICLPSSNQTWQWKMYHL